MKYCSEYWDDVRNECSHILGLERLYGASILIIGASGMLCSSLCDLLLYLNRHNSAGMKLFFAGRSQEKVELRFDGFLEGKDYLYCPFDAVKEIDFLPTCDFYIYGASNADPAAIAASPISTILANTVGLNGILNQIAKVNCKRFLYVSSSEVYGRKDNAGPYHEDDYGYIDILNPRASYPNSKRVAETMCAAYAHEYELDFVIVRPGHIYGPSISASDSRASAVFTRQASHGEDIYMKTPGNQLRSYCYTLDCAAAVLVALLNGKSKEAYNISNPDSIITLREMADSFALAGNVQLRFTEASEKEKSSYNLMDNSSLCSDKLIGLGWTPLFSMQEGAEKTIRCYA